MRTYCIRMSSKNSKISALQSDDPWGAGYWANAFSFFFFLPFFNFFYFIWLETYILGVRTFHKHNYLPSFQIKILTPSSRRRFDFNVSMGYLIMVLYILMNSQGIVETPFFLPLWETDSRFYRSKTEQYNQISSSTVHKYVRLRGYEGEESLVSERTIGCLLLRQNYRMVHELFLSVGFFNQGVIVRWHGVIRINSDFASSSSEMVLTFFC
ncbi:hypothetical protein L211DRAFT_265704 [Terfezia boudieri ATCC MYA-4762]|uniref:Uncharacterized protein n=1 Tax=Terfezia boudieri ATCC MYA-4762 TaxID=1051890 RepID=A0A3N4MMT5_9PEZI|nr:hypothetical protein L211DRAFT_265704 [Terfezia boudieri ATCC MYA-4762]